MTESNGLLIAFMGLPGAGKSSTAHALSSLVAGSELFPEPDETTWPQAVNGRHSYGYFTALTWFRSMRVPLLFQADALRKSGGVAIVDSYYDKLLVDYLNHPGMAWLLPPEDPYRSAMVDVARLDRNLLPDADCLVFLRVTSELWSRLLSERARNMDGEPQFRRSFPTQDNFLEASHKFAVATGARLIIHDQVFTSPEETALTLLPRIFETTGAFIGK